MIMMLQDGAGVLMSANDTIVDVFEELEDKARCGYWNFCKIYYNLDIYRIF